MGHGSLTVLQLQGAMKNSISGFRREPFPSFQEASQISEREVVGDVDMR